MVPGKWHDLLVVFQHQQVDVLETITLRNGMHRGHISKLARGWIALEGNAGMPWQDRVDR